MNPTYMYLNKLKLAKIIRVFKANVEQTTIDLLPVISQIHEKIMHKRLHGSLTSQSVLFSFLANTLNIIYNNIYF